MLQAAIWDAVVVGGGPAGAAFALELARYGRRVALLERSRGAQHKVCGEFLSRETVELLAYLGVDVAALGATTVEHLRLATGERCADVPLPFSAKGLSRYRMDEALLAAAAREGVHLLRGGRATSITEEGGAVVAKTGEGSWRARTVALATGKHALRGVKRSVASMVGLKMHLISPVAVRSLRNVVQLTFFNGGYAGACLIEQGVLSFGWVMEPELLRRVGSSWREHAAFLSTQSRFVAELLDGAKPLIEKPVATAAIPYGFLRSNPIAAGIYPLGDQLAVVPSFTGDGLAIALASGIAAARAVVAGKPAEAFQREMIGKLRPQFRIAAALGYFLETPALCGITVAAARMLPRIASQMVSATRLRGFEYLTDQRAPAESAR